LIGAKVNYYDERPANNNFVKGIIRLKRNVYQHRIDALQKNPFTTNNDIYHYLFVIGEMNLP
jgi:hypothetical protein